MVPFSQLFAPIGLAAALVFIASSVIHMVIRYHNADYRRLPDEDGVAQALRHAAQAPGQYMLPHCNDPKELGSAAMQQKLAQGPVATIYLKAPGPMQLGPFLARWFGYSLAISAICAYLAHAVLMAGDIHWRAAEKRLVVAMNRYAWERDPAAKTGGERRRSALRIDRVTAVRTRGVAPEIGRAHV